MVKEFNYTISILHNFLQFAYIFTKSDHFMEKTPPSMTAKSFLETLFAYGLKMILFLRFPAQLKSQNNRIN